ncbi:hypothetical protein [Nitratireductor soli]|nr:hypothetical protein [Nitratireductor soli]
MVIADCQQGLKPRTDGAMIQSCFYDLTIALATLISITPDGGWLSGAPF